MITDVPGLRVGHWTDPAAATGCTVVLFPEGTVASGEVRGGAPATREVALLDPTRTVTRLDALVLTGGSAFGLAAADGAARFCEERGMGVPTPAGPVPIVVALGLFDLLVGDPRVRPGPDQGYAACVAATVGPVEVGRVGAGAGATVGDLGPIPGPAPAARRPGGLVTAGARVGDLVVAGLVAVNSAGAPGADDARAVDIAAARTPPAPAGGHRADTSAFGTPVFGTAVFGTPGPSRGDQTGTAGFGSTTIGLVATNAALDKLGCHLVAQAAHDGLARSVFPAHGRADGDAFVAAAVGSVPADVDAVRGLAVHVVARAISDLAGHGTRQRGR